MTDEAHAAKFSMVGTPLLSAGNIQKPLGSAPCLWAHVKVYAEGGENGIHAHRQEDHLVLVVGGEATFTDADGVETVVGPYEGMMVPRGAFYSFKSSGDGNLVMLRVGAPATPGRGDDDATAIRRAINDRVAVDGSSAPGLGSQNKTGAIAGVPVPGRYFGV